MMAQCLLILADSAVNRAVSVVKQRNGRVGIELAIEDTLI
jgi:hypothetical protein